MRFRTEIGTIEGSFRISHDDKIVMLGSCFADNIGELLERDGFDVVHNPLGPLFNPLSIEAVLGRQGRPFTKDDFVEVDATWHCLWFANRFQASRADELAKMVNDLYLPLHDALCKADVIIITLGNTRVFSYGSPPRVAGNCHKLNPSFFSERYISHKEVESLTLGRHYPAARCIMTLSPVRHPGQSLASAFLGKATLRVAIDSLCRNCALDYFPSFEIVNDDLRDYRFYAADMRHPSDTAVEYIYEHFSNTYFSPATKAEAERRRRLWRRAAHTPFTNGIQTATDN